MHGRAGEEAAAAEEGAASAEVAREVEEDVNAEDDEAVEETALAATPVAPRRRAGRKAPKPPKATWLGAPLAEAAGVTTYRCVRHRRLACALHLGPAAMLHNAMCTAPCVSATL